MQEWIVDLIPIGGGTPTKVRLFAPNQASARKIAKEIYSNYRIGGVKPMSN